MGVDDVQMGILSEIEIIDKHHKEQSENSMVNDEEMCRTWILNRLAKGVMVSYGSLANSRHGFSDHVFRNVYGDLIEKGEIVENDSALVYRQTAVPMYRQPTATETLSDTIPDDQSDIDRVRKQIAHTALSAKTSFQEYVDYLADPVLHALLGAHAAAIATENAIGETACYEALDHYIGRQDSEVLSLLWHTKGNAEGAVEEFNKESGYKEEHNEEDDHDVPCPE